jgi:hypothetical protein
LSLRFAASNIIWFYTFLLDIQLIAYALDNSASVVTGYGLGGRFRLPAGATNSSVLRDVQTYSCTMGTGADSQGVYQQRDEADRSAPSSGEVKKGGAAILFYYTSSCRSA